MMLDETKYKNTTRVISGINNVVYNNDTVLLCDTASGVVQLDLLQIPTDRWSTVYKLYVIDNTNNASVNNITITAPVGYKINGQQTLVIDVNGGSVIIEVSSNGSYIGKLSYIVSTGNFIETKDEGITLTTETKSYNFTGDGVTATAVGDDVTVDIPSDKIASKEEGVDLTTNTKSLNFVGEGVTASAVGDDVTVTIPSDKIESKDEGLTLTANTKSVNYTGNLVTASAVGDDVTVDINLEDTGWVDLLGFSFYDVTTGNAGALKPQCRRIGNRIEFRGTAYIPLSDGGGSALTLTLVSGTTNTYIVSDEIKPAIVGAGSVVINTDGSIVWNGGNSVIPNSVVPTLTNLDNSYSKSNIIGGRIIKLLPNSSTLATTVGNVILTADKKLLFQNIADVEDTNVPPYNSGNGASTSALNYIISKFRSGENAPRFSNAFSVVTSSPVNGVDAIELDFTNTLVYPNFVQNGVPAVMLDGNSPNCIGGMNFVLDGLYAFI